MDTSALREQLERTPFERVKFGVVDIDGLLRGKIVHKDKLLQGLEAGFGFCNVVFGWDSQDRLYDNGRVSGWHAGYPDAVARIDPGTYRQLPWEDQLPFFLADFSAEPGPVKAACPRTLLRRIIDQVEAAGYRPFCGLEYEWFNFRREGHADTGRGFQLPEPISAGMFGYSLLRFAQAADYVSDLFEQLLAFRVPIEALHTETGPGVYEAALRYSSALEAADRAVLFKYGVKAIAARHDILPSFMAKWSNELPGCGGHLHQSLRKAGQTDNAFHSAKAENGMSELMRHYLAGQLHCLPYLLPLFAPTVNSYKRLVAGSWAAVSVSWGLDNRTTALRVINSSPGATRLETRVPGADANPYLVVAAALAAGLYGIRNELALELAPTQGNEYAQSDHRPLPRTLAEATAAMRDSALPGELLGADFVDHFLRTRDWECRQYDAAVTDWELRRYFSAI